MAAAVTYPVGTIAHTKAKEAANKLKDWIEKHNNPADWKYLVEFQNRPDKVTHKKHQNITDGHNKGFHYYEGYDPFEIAYDMSKWKGPWRNLVEVDAHWKPTGIFYVTNDHYTTMEGPFNL